MSRLLTLGLLAGLLAPVGCGGGGAQRDLKMVDVSATVTGPDGKPLPKTLVVVLQPQDDTPGAKLQATTDGTFTGQAVPGKYIYYVKLAKGDESPKGIPIKFTEPTSGNTVEVAAGKPLVIAITR